MSVNEEFMRSYEEAREESREEFGKNYSQMSDARKVAFGGLRLPRSFCTIALRLSIFCFIVAALH